jgi:hypothetical protein
MPETPKHLLGPQTARDDPVAQLTARWRGGEAPDLAAFLRDAGPLSAEELADVLCIDQRERWLRGERPDAEAYLRLYDSFYPHSEYALELVFNEFLVRRQRAEAPALQEYQRRFPELAEPLQVQAGLYDAMAQTGAVADSSTPTPREVPALTRYADDTQAQRSVGPKRMAGWPALPGYEIVAEVGRGGMGVVYKARQLSLQRHVAIKVVPENLADESVFGPRFHREQLLAARLTHPNLVSAFDAGRVRGLQYLVMEFVEGVSLDRLMDQRNPLPVAEACALVRQAALGLQYIHEHGLVHRDIKPSNLMLTHAGQVKVLDLGLARILNESAPVGQITSHGQFLGTLDYMAPEQCLNSHDVDIRADVYSLGCTLYHLLTGQPPFAAPVHETLFKKMKAHIEAPVPPLCDLRPDVCDRLAEVLAERMLAKDREGRFGTPGEVVVALHAFATGANLVGFLQAKTAGAGLLAATTSSPVLPAVPLPTVVGRPLRRSVVVPRKVEPEFESFKRLLLDLARERSADALLRLIVNRLAECSSVALARIWLMGPGDVCATCRMRPECPNQTRCLHLVASAGRSLHDGVDWTRLDGQFRRFPLGVRKVGLIAACADAIEVPDLQQDSTWLASPAFAKEEDIRAFGGQPLIYHGEVLGVLAVFFRVRLAGDVLLWLRMIADRAAAAIANARAVEEIERLRTQLQQESATKSPAKEAQ